MDLPFTIPSPKNTDSKTLELDLKVVTPILGGGVWARQLDSVDVIRTQTIRGQLRFWWRAITADAASPEDLYIREKEIWGGTGQAGTNQTQSDATMRSKVRVVVRDVNTSCGDVTDDITQGSDSAYALWPARATHDEDPAPRWKPGVKFHFSITYPTRYDGEIKRAISAWLCFGGYGSRTRRGVGKVAPDCDASRELVPAETTETDLKALLGLELFAAPQVLTDWPRLRGVQLAFGSANAKGETAWHTGLNWLRDFRQGAPGGGGMGFHSPDHARVEGEQRRPSVSNWPEADKVRNLNRGEWGHKPQHNDKSVLPRAALGLPIIAQFQRKNRDQERIHEPADFELQWIDDQKVLHDRLASPLIVGAMPIRDGKFVPFALWLGRGYPAGAKVVVIQNNRPLPGSEANFDELVAPGDTARFNPLAIGQAAEAGTRMRTAFFEWLTRRYPNITLLT